MRHSRAASVREPVGFLRRRFLQGDDLPFTDVLTGEVIAQALRALTGWLDRIFSPLVTLWGFLGQVLSADHSCRAAAARLIAHRLARGQRPCDHVRADGDRHVALQQADRHGQTPPVHHQRRHCGKGA